MPDDPHHSTVPFRPTPRYNLTTNFSSVSRDRVLTRSSAKSGSVSRVISCVAVSHEDSIRVVVILILETRAARS